VNRTRLLQLGSVSLALGVLVCFVIYKSLQTRTGTNNEVDVILAANDIQVGAKLVYCPINK
jgi:hypothetical protein